MNVELRDTLVGIFREAGHAHHLAFAATDGADLDWPIWYAEYLYSRITDVLQMPFTRSQLARCLIDADLEHSARDPQSDWPEFYADHFIECFSRSMTPAQDKLALYHSETCPFCAFVRSAIDRLEVDVELREIFDEPQYREELVEARGRATVPVLRITSPDGEERWMPESRDIVRYLEAISEPTT